MKKRYVKPCCEAYNIKEQTFLLGMSVYDAGNSVPVDMAGDGDTPVTDDDGIIWNDAKRHSGFDLWDD